MPIGDILRHQAARKPADTLAISYPDASLTWDMLDLRTNRLARFYDSLGVTKGDKVVIALGNGAAFHEVAFAVWKLGASPAALSPKLSSAEFLGLLDLMQPRLIVTNAASASELPVQSVRSDADTSAFSDAPFANEIAPYWKVSGSGGSTGRPKVIVHDLPGSFDPVGTQFLNEYHMSPDTVVLNPGPLYHNAPFLYSHSALFTGSTVIGMDRFDPEEALRLIEAHKVTWVLLVPTMMHRIWSLPRAVREKYDLSSLRTIWHMASICPAWLKEAWIDWLGAERIWERYGGTEGFGSTVISGPEWLEHRGSVGRVTGKTKLKIIGEDGQLCGPGEVGELFFLTAGPKPPSFYVGAEPRRDAEGYLSLGDLGYRTEDGFVYLADRRTDLIIRGGANIYPAEIEAALDEHPGIASSIVIGIPCDELGARVHAIIQPKAEADLTLRDVHEFLKQRLVTYKLPESYETVSSMLRDDAGKARRSALRSERIDWIREGRNFQNAARDLSNPAAGAKKAALGGERSESHAAG